ncbi:MAG: tetratricopeptide repeat protein [Muribaculaceae bacterium]|nr:tetratricopeptide repeat protein [Muribaculaceae bacterium]
MKLNYILKLTSKLLASLLLGLAISSASYAKESPSALADTLYLQGEYAKAAEAYESIAKVDGDSPQLLFNLANAYAQSGDLGKAILYYSRAHRLDPTDKEIKNNLEYFASKVEDSNRAELRGKKISVSPDHDTFFQSVRNFICADFPMDMWAYIGAFAFIALIGLIAVYLFCSDVRLRKFGFFGGIAAFFVSLICVVFAFMSASYYDSHDQAVLIAYKTELLIEPSSDAKPASNLLCQGTRFDIVAEETDVEGVPTWYKVRLNSDIEGWIRVSDVEII